MLFVIPAPQPLHFGFLLVILSFAAYLPPRRLHDGAEMKDGSRARGTVVLPGTMQALLGAAVAVHTGVSRSRTPAPGHGGATIGQLVTATWCRGYRRDAVLGRGGSPRGHSRSMPTGGVCFFFPFAPNPPIFLTVAGFPFTAG